MSDNDRMDRAKRIREMREGARDDGDEPSETGDGLADGGPEKQTMEDIVDDSPDSGDSNGEGDESQSDQQTAMETNETESEGEAESVADADEESAASAGNQGGSDQTTEQSAETAESDVTAPLPEMDELEEALDSAETTGDAEAVAAGLGDSGGGAATATQAPTEPDTASPAAPQAEAAGEATQAGVVEDAATTTEEETRVLEFTLDDEHYCLDIEYIEEIVKHENITRVPNTPAHVEGVVDLRGQITTILNPKVTIGKENDEAGALIVVFDSGAFEDQGHIGWVVDDVRQVSPIIESEVNDPPMSEDYINGVIDREDDDEFVIWTSPELAFEDED